MSRFNVSESLKYAWLGLLSYTFASTMKNICSIWVISQKRMRDLWIRSAFGANAN